MGNCQAADAAAVVIQYPGGKVERLHWPTTAANVMKSNPGYHVALVTLDVPPNERHDGGVGIRITRVKLLKPKEMLLLGQVYRLIASQGNKTRTRSTEEHTDDNERQTMASFAPEHLRNVRLVVQ
ncbi:hypothetical protein ZIOFF_067185 [Zingiber officinale]|uniref:Uncharacterized protein n=1 Tax=Zingiber officinale TaxID=94328 RepID=A0A8J5C658_ZINOF|nr:hypothetical protein ZIOFF_067185 [Zingiber officinale]